MSELTLCNYCALQVMKAQAAERGVELVMGQHMVEWETWVTARFSDEDEPAAFFKILTTHCAC